MNERTTQAETGDTSGAAPGDVTPWRAETDGGIDVREEDLVLVRAQRLYQLRCECGRSWFELVLKTFVQCPACHKPGLVGLHPDALPDDEGKEAQLDGPPQTPRTVRGAASRF